MASGSFRAENHKTIFISLNSDYIYEAYGVGGTVPFYTKVMDEIKIDIFLIKNVEIDVGILSKDHQKGSCI